MSRIKSGIKIKSVIKEHTVGNVIAKPRREEKVIDKEDKK